MRPEKIGRTKGFARKPDDLISRASRDDVFSLRCGGPRGSPVVQPDVLPATVEPVSEGLGLWRPPSRRCQPASTFGSVPSSVNRPMASATGAGARQASLRAS
jgi:hypothetical protein